MKPKVKEKWLEALRSGEYKQTKKHLRDENGFCCLGVLCDIHAKETGGEWLGGDDAYTYQDWGGILPPSVMEWAGLDGADADLPETVRVGYETCGTLSSVNDAGASFERIATIIEKQL